MPSAWRTVPWPRPGFRIRCRSASTAGSPAPIDPTMTMDDATYTRPMGTEAHTDRDDWPAATGSRLLWDGGPLSPLNIAAYVTWLPVSFGMLDFLKLAALDPVEWL